MGAYILRRLLLIIPTLLGIMIINFALTQFVPGGPIEQTLARLQGEGDVFSSFSGDGGGNPNAEETFGSDSDYIGARGLPKEFIETLEIEFGFARIVCEDGFTGEPDLDDPACQKEEIGTLERFGIMMWNYIRLDFGESYFRSIGVMELVLEKMPVSISLGLWSTIIAYMVSIPLGIRKAVKDGTSFDTYTSAAIIVAYAIPGFLFAILLLVLFAGGSYFQIFPLRGLTSENWDELSFFAKIADYFWHIFLPVLATTISAFATLTQLNVSMCLSPRRPPFLCLRHHGLQCQMSFQSLHFPAPGPGLERGLTPPGGVGLAPTSSKPNATVGPTRAVA